MIIRELKISDIPEILHVQNEAYQKEYIEGPDTFLNKIKLFPEGCLGYFEASSMLAYVFSQPWQRDNIVPLDSEFNRLPEKNDCFYIHDLSVMIAVRGKGIGEILVARLFDLARKLGLNHCALVAVQGSETYWARFGFQPKEQIMYAANIHATYMVLELPRL